MAALPWSRALHSPQYSTGQDLWQERWPRVTRIPMPFPGPASGIWGWGHSTETHGQAGMSVSAMYQHQLEEEEDGHSLSRG